MTGQEIDSIQDAIQNAGLNGTKYPKKVEIKIPRAKFPGIYLSIPTDGKSFKLQVYFQQIGIAFIEKLNIRGYVLTGDDMNKFFSLTEVKGIPTEEKIAEYLSQAMESVVNVGIVREKVPELVA
ncbi:MAG: hypothetical protein PF517_00860 [Salinivirgaceae bacterium]|jgi:hypothetical protein|nr:hypothetical protein [Salinivirgaceae bacterium]